MPDPIEALKKATGIGPDKYAQWFSDHPILGALANAISPVDPHQTTAGPLDIIGAALPLVGSFKGIKAIKGLTEAERLARAEAQGYTKLGWHGTNALENFRQFDPQHVNGSDFGIHVATTPKTANAAVSKSFPRITPEAEWEYSNRSRVYPVRFKADNPLELPDMAKWSSARDWRRILNRTSEENFGEITNDPELALKLRQLAEEGSKTWDQKPWIETLKREIQRNSGYDSIKYNNYLEGMGEPSYLLFDPRQIKSVFAQFDPRKYGKSKDILAGVGGAAIAGLQRSQDK